MAPDLKEQLVERERCGVCGLVHPFLRVCPFVEEVEVREETSVTDGRRVRTRVERTRYFPRPKVFAALEKLTVAKAEEE